MKALLCGLSVACGIGGVAGSAGKTGSKIQGIRRALIAHGQTIVFGVSLIAFALGLTSQPASAGCIDLKASNNALSTRRLALVSSLALLSITAGCMPVVAHEPGTIHVQLTDLNLGTQTGRETANDRLRHAARLVCSRVSDPEDLGRQIHVKACIEQTMAKATESLQLLVAQSGAVQLARGASR